jgi:hypothetical protein
MADRSLGRPRISVDWAALLVALVAAVLVGTGIIGKVPW